MGKEKEQRERLAKNAENQRNQDRHFGEKDLDGRRADVDKEIERRAKKLAKELAKEEK